MPLSIPDQFQVKYTNKWGTPLGQKVSRLKEYVTTKSDCSGKVIFFDQFGKMKFKEKTTRLGTTVLDEVETGRRALRPRFFDSAVGFDEYDKNQLSGIDVPVSEAIEGFRNAANCMMDQVMIQGFLGTNYTGEDGMTPVELNAKQIIKASYVESGSAVDSNLTVAKLRATLQKFMKNEAWGQDSDAMGDRLVLACTSSQIMSLLRATEVTSSDYSSVKALYEGKVDSFMGFKFLRTELLPSDSSGVRQCLAWVKSKAQFGLWNDFSVKISVRDDKDEALQVRAKFGCNATRLDELGFVNILCKEEEVA